jgi:hypothetical protein
MGRRTDDDWESNAWSGDDSSEDDDGSEEFDSDQTVECPACGREIYDDAERCPHCGEYLTEPDRLGRGKPLWIIVTAVVVLAAVVLAWVF